MITITSNAPLCLFYTSLKPTSVNEFSFLTIRNIRQKEAHSIRIDDSLKNVTAYDITVNKIEFSFKISYYINEYTIRIVKARGSVRNVGASD